MVLRNLFAVPLIKHTSKLSICSLDLQSTAHAILKKHHVIVSEQNHATGSDLEDAKLSE